jgi:hypothetical protein
MLLYCVTLDQPFASLGINFQNWQDGERDLQNDGDEIRSPLFF